MYDFPTPWTAIILFLSISRSFIFFYYDKKSLKLQYHNFMVVFFIKIRYHATHHRGVIKWEQQKKLP